MVDDELINGEEPEKFISPFKVYVRDRDSTTVDVVLYIVFCLLTYYFWYVSNGLYIILAIFVIIYTIWERFTNNKFLLYKSHKILRITNSSFPFNRDISYKFEDIKEIDLLSRIEVNRVKITLNNGESSLYLCKTLRVMYDESVVEKTLNDFGRNS